MFMLSSKTNGTAISARIRQAAISRSNPSVVPPGLSK
jgi:hypothetical protein